MLNAKLNEYASSKLVITDRLHGMIFAAIVGTPCIAIDNISHKVKNCYEWIKYLEYIYYCDNPNSFIDMIDNSETIIQKNGKYTIEPIIEKFELIKEEIIKEFNS